MALDHHLSDAKTFSSGATGNTSHSVTLPTNIAIGDLLSLVVEVTLQTTISTPAGWTQVATAIDGNGGQRISWFRKVADGSEGSTVSVTVGAANQVAAVAWRTTGYNSSNPINVSGTNNGTTTTPAVAPAVTTTVNNCDVFRTAGTRNNTNGVVGITDPGSNTSVGQSIDPVNEVSAAMSVCFATLASAGSSGTANFTLANNGGDWASLTVAIEPAPVAVVDLVSVNSPKKTSHRPAPFKPGLAR